MNVRSKLIWSKGTGNKKYKVTVKQLGKKKTIQFGDNRYGQYKDKTPLKLYSHMDTLDKDRRRLYRLRHSYPKRKYTPGWFALKYLW